LNGQAVEGIARATLEDADGTTILEQPRDEDAPHEPGGTCDEDGAHGG
jgi:hypothetical protein